MIWSFWGKEDVNRYMEKKGISGKNWNYYEPMVANPGEDCGIDLRAPYAFDVEPHSFGKVNTFVRFRLPPDGSGRLLPRGKDDFLIGSGVIDTGYTGPIVVKILNHTDVAMHFSAGDSVGQLVVYRKILGEAFLVEGNVEELSYTVNRGNSGSILHGVSSGYGAGDVDTYYASMDDWTVPLNVGGGSSKVSPAVLEQRLPVTGENAIDVASIVERDLIEYQESKEMDDDYTFDVGGLIVDLEDRIESGKREYGVRLHTNNGRSALVDAYQEALDLLVYLRQYVYETESGWPLYDKVVDVVVGLKQMVVS